MEKFYDDQKLKKYEQDILDYFKEVCNKNNITYYLAFGTLLGAIRHKGFIPWDDDIDVFLKPDDYYRFKDAIKKEQNDKYFYQSLETEKHYSQYFSKIRMNNTKAVEKKNINDDMHKGIYIDIFPLIPFPNNKKELKKMYQRIKCFRILVEADCKDKCKYESYGFIGKCISKITRLIPRTLRNIVARNLLKKLVLNKAEHGKYYSIIDILAFSKDYFNETKEAIFEGEKYTIPKNYDAHLTEMYGDYMQLPKVEDRKAHSFVEVSFDTKTEDNKIDFILFWVDGNDPKWQTEKNKYNPKKAKNGVNGIARYREWDNLKYWFRGVEKYAPWVNNIYFVTCGQIPKWLNRNNPKLKFITHNDYIPKEYLPTFSSHPIELNIHRIKELSEQFVLFNDDIFLLDNVKKEDFFKNGLPCDNYNEVNLDLSKEDETFAEIIKNNYRLINKYFNKRKVIISNCSKFINKKYGLKRNLQTIKTTILKKAIVGINNNHIAQPYLKSYYKKVWDLEYKIFDQTSKNKFRSKTDINEWSIRYFQLMDKHFIPRDFKLGKYFIVGNNNEEIINTIKNQKYKIICINDADTSIDFEKCKKEINSAFEEILPGKSSFEK